MSGSTKWHKRTSRLDIYTHAAKDNLPLQLHHGYCVIKKKKDYNVIQLLAPLCECKFWDSVNRWRLRTSLRSLHFVLLEWQWLMSQDLLMDTVYKWSEGQTALWVFYHVIVYCYSISLAFHSNCLMFYLVPQTDFKSMESTLFTFENSYVLWTQHSLFLQLSLYTYYHFQHELYS